MRVILNNHAAGATTFQNAMSRLLRGADTLSMAVSYLQLGGWNLFQERATGLDLAKMRIVCTDQFGFTQPAAVAKAMQRSVQIRNYAAEGTFHPKVYIAHDTHGQPKRYLIGSANLSFSAWTDSVEAGILSDDSPGLRTIGRWFNDLFNHQSIEFTPERLRVLEENWRIAATRRAHARLRRRPRLIVPPGSPPQLDAEDIDTLEDVFATVKLPIGLLNMDYARNNIRNLNRICEVLRDWETISTSTSAGKQRSEMKLLGFADGSELTALGRAAAARAQNQEEVARLWCEWLQQTPDDALLDINERLVSAKRVFSQFWRLKPEVREYFLNNAVSPADRKTLQTIELLCNAQEIVQELSLEDFRELAPLLEQPQRLPHFVRKAIIEYRGNKGTRSWDSTDRITMPNAWHQVGEAGR